METESGRFDRLDLWLPSADDRADLVATAVTRSTAVRYACPSGPLGELEGVRHVEASPYPRRVKQLIRPRPVS